MFKTLKNIFVNKTKKETSKENLEVKKIFYKPKKPLFLVEQIGLLFIVYEEVDTGLDIVYIEESRWECQEKADKHCKLLNELN